MGGLGEFIANDMSYDGLVAKVLSLEKVVKALNVPIDYNQYDTKSHGHILNRPFYSDHIEVFGEVDVASSPRVNFKNETEERIMLFKVSDQVCSKENIIGAVLRVRQDVRNTTAGVNYQTVYRDRRIAASDTFTEFNGGYVVSCAISNDSPSWTCNCYVHVVTDYEAYDASNPALVGQHFTSNGIYVGWTNKDTAALAIELAIEYIDLSFDVIHKIDNKFIDLLNHPDVLELRQDTTIYCGYVEPTSWIDISVKKSAIWEVFTHYGAPATMNIGGTSLSVYYAKISILESKNIDDTTQVQNVVLVEYRDMNDQSRSAVYNPSEYIRIYAPSDSASGPITGIYVVKMKMLYASNIYE